GFTPSFACRVTATVASSLHVRVGVRVEVPVKVQTVPGPAVTMVRVHEIVRVSLSGSVALPASFVALPSLPLYGPPAFTVGAPLLATEPVLDPLPPLSSVTVTVTVRVPLVA